MNCLSLYADLWKPLDFSAPPEGESAPADARPPGLTGLSIAGGLNPRLSAL